ncbi:MAG: molybdenum cofactor biosynthesis protein MoaE, partial [Methylococcales bacterium]
MKIQLHPEPFNPWQELENHQRQQLRNQQGEFGATASFVGTMRDFNEGDQVSAMTLEYYPGMTEKQLEKIAETAYQRWELIEVFIQHRVGEIKPGQPIVLVAVWSSHRGNAFDACRFIMEELKHRAPFWKKEDLDGQSRWVESNTDGY